MISFLFQLPDVKTLIPREKPVSIEYVENKWSINPLRNFVLNNDKTGIWSFCIILSIHVMKTII
jgi:hypothetical protein